MAKQFVDAFSLQKENIPNFGSYPFSLPVVKHFERLNLHKNVTFIIGENGTGKSTLLEAFAVAYGFSPEGGGRNVNNFNTYNTHSELHKYMWVHRDPKNEPNTDFFLRAESFYNVASNIDTIANKGNRRSLNFYGGKSLHEQSHGESFLSLFNHRFLERGFYILDEPEAALSPQRQMSFLIRLHQLVQQECQFIITTHSPIILSYPNAKVIEISEDEIQEIVYEDSEQLRLYKLFINQPDYMLKHLDIDKF